MRKIFYFTGVWEYRVIVKKYTGDDIGRRVQANTKEMIGPDDFRVVSGFCHSKYGRGRMLLVLNEKKKKRF